MHRALLGFVSLVSLVTGGCGYRFVSDAPLLPESIRSVRVPLLDNRTFEPGLEAIFTQALRDQLGRIGVLGGEASDGAVTGELLSLTFDPVQPGRLASYRLNAAAVLRLEKDGRVLATTRVSGVDQFLSGAGSLESDANRGAAIRRLAASMMRDGYERLRTDF